MKRKSEAYSLFLQFKVLVENLFSYTIKMFQSDGGKEFDNSSMLDLFHKHSIYFCKSYPNTQQHNGVDVWKHRHILEMVCTFLIDASKLAYVCVEAEHDAIFLIN